MLNDDADLPMDPTVDVTWAEPAADARTGIDATPAPTVGAVLADALRRAAVAGTARVSVGAADSPFAFVVGAGRIAPDGASVEPPLDQLAAALALDSAAVNVAPDASVETAEALADASIDLEIALAQAAPLTAAWAEIMRVVPDDRARVQLATRLPAGGVDVDDEQWRLIARVGTGQSVGELATALEVGHLAAMRAVHDLAELGVVAVTAAPRLLPTPPAAPFAAPAPGTVAFPAPTLPPPGGAPAASFPPPPPTAAVEAPAAPSDAPPAPFDAPAAPAPAADDGWTTVATTEGGDWSYERLSPDIDDWSDEPDHEAAAAAWDEQVAAGGHTRVDDEWAVEAVDIAPTADLWADVPAAPTAGAGASPVAPLVPSRAVTPLPAYPRDEMPALPAEPAPAATDEVLGSVAGDDELVNRALLFKFLSSMRD